MRRLLLAISIAMGLFVARPAAAQDLLIIANPSVRPPAALSVGEIAAIYLLRITHWPDGHHIVPVNREATSRLRSEFTEKVLRQQNGALAAYWNEMHFRGKLPPVVQESEEAMLAFVASVPGAIGYISAGTPPEGVTVLARVR